MTIIKRIFILFPQSSKVIVDISVSNRSVYSKILLVNQEDNGELCLRRESMQKIFEINGAEKTSIPASSICKDNKWGILMLQAVFTFINDSLQVKSKLKLGWLGKF